MGKKINLAAGAALSALLATGAALYLAKTKHGQKTAKHIQLHAKALGKKIAAKIHKTKAVTEKKYDKIVQEVVLKYAKDKKIAEEAAKKVAKDLKGNWQTVKREISKKLVKAVKKPAKNKIK